MKAEKKKEVGVFEEIKETFVLKDIKSLDNRNRINIGSEIVEKLTSSFNKVDSFKIFLGEGGDILLRPAANIPSRELWLYENEKAVDMVRKGLKDAKEGKTEKIKDIDQYIEKL